MSIALNKLRLMSGFSWDDLAQLFDVSKQEILYWSSAWQHSKFQENQIADILDVVEYIDTGTPTRNRKLLMQTKVEGKSCFDMLIAGEYELVKESLGKGNGNKKPKSGGISKEEQELRRPLPPDVLANPLPDVSYQQTGKSRPAKAERSRVNQWPPEVPPDILIDALQDTSHKEVGKSRPAKTQRINFSQSG